MKSSSTLAFLARAIQASGGWKTAKKAGGIETGRDRPPGRDLP
jgi:hypothetical protein